ncbi:hypothetical protein GGR50DRAFT_705051 [Xylaria sp. CBS 124048]|nr:hypothetical protein GGR50DRAFT_705051 [Xylaria sp. CBS 124048]
MPGAQSFTRFGDFPAEIRLNVWEEHFSTFFIKAPCMHTLNGGCLSLDGGRLDPLWSLRLVTSFGRMTKSMADSYDENTGDVLPEWKTVIHDPSPAYWSVSTTKDDVFDVWPRLRPLINREAFEVARYFCKSYEVIDLWLDDSTLCISQPRLVDVAADVFRIDPDIAKMMLGLKVAPWLGRIRRLAIGPFKLHRPCDTASLMRILRCTWILDEVYILLSPGVVRAPLRYDDVQVHSRITVSSTVTQIGVEGRFEMNMRELEGLSVDDEDVFIDMNHFETLRVIATELRRRGFNTQIKCGYIDV